MIWNSGQNELQRKNSRVIIKSYEQKSIAECRLMLTYHEDKIDINTKNLYTETSKALKERGVSVSL